VSHIEPQVRSAAIDSLELATTYYYRIVARNSVGTHHGETRSFVTPERYIATLAFVRRGDIYTYTPVDGSTVRLTTGGNFGHPTWSPDGNRIAFGQEHVWPSGIYVINADGSGLRRVGDGWSPAWSPDGRRLAFATLRDDGQGAIIVTSVDEPIQPTVRIGLDRGHHNSPTWSPDGTRIAFISDWGAFDFAFDVYVANADGSGVVEQLTNGFLGNQSSWPNWKIYAQPSWSPDGLSLAVVECDEWQYFSCAASRVGIMSADGSGFRVLTDSNGFARPSWTPDGSTVVFSRTCWYHDCPSAIFEVALDGTDVRLLLDDAHSGVFRP
jgi:Tol biopolymer transport system component